MPRGQVRLDGLTWRPLGRRLPTLVDIELTVHPGERVLLVGPSGAGKSTLLLALLGALGTTVAGDLSGQVAVDGRLGYMAQNPADAVVAEHMGRDVAFGLENLGLSRAEIWPRVDDALAEVGLPYLRDHVVTALSGGELQRLVLAGVLVLRPDVLVLDEPTSMLDSAAAAAARAAIIAAVGDRTMIIVEHRFDGWLDQVDRVVVMRRGGTLAFDGSVSAFLKAAPWDGVWMPGAPAPAPIDVPVELVLPDQSDGVEARDVAVTLATRTLRGTHRAHALRQFSAAVAPGLVTALVGPSGSGKSTALGVLGGLQRIDAGRVSPDRSTFASRRLAAEVGWMPQNPEHGFLSHTVREEIERTSRRLGREVAADHVIDVLGLASLGAAHPFRLSGGEQRRLALAAALAHRPGLVLLDEPTVGQDPMTWAMVTGWMAAARDAGAAVAFATHDSWAPRDREIPLTAGLAR